MEKVVSWGRGARGDEEGPKVGYALVSPADKTNKKLACYEEIVEKEDKEAKLVNPSKIVERGEQICAELDKNIFEILDLLKKSSDNCEELETKMEEGLVKFSSLRDTNKLLKLKLKSVKDEVNFLRNLMDSELLHLQNLLYEANALQTEVQAIAPCKEDEELGIEIEEKFGLITTQKFCAEAHSTISKPEFSSSSSSSDGHRHALAMARLENELLTRKELSSECVALEQRKDSVEAIIMELSFKLKSLGPMLDNLHETTKSVEEFLGGGGGDDGEVGDSSAKAEAD